METHLRYRNNKLPQFPGRAVPGWLASDFFKNGLEELQFRFPGRKVQLFYASIIATMSIVSPNRRMEINI